MPLRYKTQLGRADLGNFRRCLHQLDIDVLLKELTDIILLRFEEWEDEPNMVEME